MKLRQIAHTRAGDKGNTVNISIIAFEPAHYPLLAKHITAERVKAFFKEIVAGDILRYELPNIGALNFVMYKALGGGVTRTLAIDPHGKSLSSAILDMEIPED